jgi:hypothetical protein
MIAGPWRSLSACPEQGHETLFPHFAAACVTAVEDRGDLVVFTMGSARLAATCPKCGTESTRTHGRYQRTSVDAPIAGRRVRLEIAVRRFRRVDPTAVQ